MEIKKRSKQELKEISKNLDKTNISYSDVINKQLKDCVWIDHPHNRLTFFEKLGFI